MSENEGQEQKKPRAKRSASKFIVLRCIEDTDRTVQPRKLCEVVIEASTIKAARAEIIKQKIVGDLLTVCVRRRGTSTVQTTLEIKGL